MIKYKLKKEARQFFKNDLHEKIYTLETWNKQGMPINILDEVDRVHIEYGIKTSEHGTDLKGWSSNDGNPKGHFHFTVNVSDIDNDKYEDISVPKLMDEMQKVINSFFKQYLD